MFEGTDWILPVVAAPFVGSFLGVVAMRLPVDRPLLWARSACPECRHVLGIPDLVPLLSWLMRGGRCRHCSARIPYFYPAIELAAVAVALWAAAVLTGWLLWATCVLGWLLLVLAVIDQRHLRLPDGLTLALTALGLGVAWAIDPQALLDHAIGAAGGFAAFAIIGWIYRRVRHRDGLGLGDAKLLAAAGAWVSWQGLPSVVLWGAALGLAGVLLRRLLGAMPALDQPIPFGPSLCLGLWLVWLYGPFALA